LEEVKEKKQRKDARSGNLATAGQFYPKRGGGRDGKKRNGEPGSRVTGYKGRESVAKGF